MTEITTKIKNKVAPSDKEKEALLYKLNKQLNEDDHIYIFTEILQNMDKKIYTITENCTLFDLNDLDNENFWKICYYTQLFIDQHERQKEINSAKKENDDLSEQFVQKVEEKLRQIKEQSPEKIDSTNLSEYEKLRIDALSQCSYSSYAKSSDSHEQSGRCTGVEKTIYSDNYQQRWKQLNKTEEINRKVARISIKCENTKQDQEVVGDQYDDDPDCDTDSDANDCDDDDEYDDDDVMVNYKKNADDVQDIDLGEIKKFLPSGSKVKLSLKARQTNGSCE
jgi:hypothetical protein